MLSRTFSSLALLALTTLSFNASAVTSAELYRTAGEGFGKFEARVRYASGDGIIGSFFLWKDGSELSSVYWNELDFEKLGATCELQSNSIYGLPQTNHEAHHPELLGLCAGYHVYAYEWTPDYISWAVDGVEIRRDSGPDAAAYAENATDGLQVRFNIWPGDASFGGSFDESSLPAYQYVDWAQYSEHTPGAGDGGSDFTLAWREDFDSLPAGWATASWDSPLGLSTHNPKNVVFADGIAVIALTADDAPGYTGSPPEGVPQNSGGAGSGGLPATAGSHTSSGGDGTEASPGRAEGCAYVNTPDPAGGRGVFLWGLLALVGLTRLPRSARSVSRA